MIFKVIIVLTSLIAISIAQITVAARTRSLLPRVETATRDSRPRQPVLPQSRAIVDESPKPYSFSYNNADEYGTQWTREESRDANGVVRGSYGYRDATGLFRTVEYVADAGGYRAVVNTNEPGVVPHKPANVVYNVVNGR